MDEINFNHQEIEDSDLEKQTNLFIENVQKNIENFSYNKIVANFYEIYSLLNKIVKVKINKEKWIENFSKILITMSPVIPHFANECLEKLGITKGNKIIYWPEINKSVLIQDTINFVIQVNGKKRGLLKLKKNITKNQILSEIDKDSKIKNFINNKSIKNTIFVPNRLVNIITEN